MAGHWSSGMISAYIDLLNVDISFVKEKYDFVSIVYETTGLVTYQDEFYPSAVGANNHPDFWTLLASQYSNYFEGQQGGAREQRFYPQGFQTFLDNVVTPFKKDVYLKMRWTTTGEFPVYPITTDSNLLLGKKKFVSDDHRMQVLHSQIGQVLKMVNIGSSKISGIYFAFMDSYGAGTGTHYGAGLVKVEMNKSTRDRSIKKSGHWLADLIEVNGFEPDKENCKYNSKRDDTPGGQFPEGFHWSLATAAYQVNLRFAILSTIDL